jgi:hypothetical protein
MAHDASSRWLTTCTTGRAAPRRVSSTQFAGSRANPNLVCSEGQLNVIALSYFLGLNLETERGGLPFAVFDDPL